MDGSLAVPVEVAVAADREESVLQRERTKLDRAPELYPPDLGAVGAKRAYRPVGAATLLRDNLLIYGLGGLIVPFIGIKLIDMILAALGLA